MSKKRTLNISENVAEKLSAASMVLGVGFGMGEIGDKACLEWLSRNSERIKKATDNFRNRMATVLTQ